MKPGELKFKAIVDGKEVKNGDYWAPGIKKTNERNSYRVRISSNGIHFTKKVMSEDYVEVFRKGELRRYYDEFESEQTWSEGVELILLNGDESK